MPDTTVAQPEVAPTETAPAETAPASTETDPFAVDESQFVSLTPEQRAALDPVLSKWKENAKSYAQKEREAEGKKYTDHVKRSAALENGRRRIRRYRPGTRYRLNSCKRNW